MEVRLESRSEASAREGAEVRGKRRRPMGEAAPLPAAAAREAAEDLCRGEQEWLERLAGDPASFAAVEREVHDRLRGHADRFVAGLLARVGERPETARHVREAVAAAEVPLRAVEKNGGR